VSADTVDAADAPLAVEQRGEGGAIVFVHGTASDRSVWRETLAALGSDRRAVCYDRRAYGQSGAPDPYEGTTVQEQAEDLVAVIEGTGAAAGVLCGHGLGAIVCLDLLRRHSGLACGAVLIEPPLLALSPLGPEVVGGMRVAIEEAAREGGAEAAVEAYLEAMDGDGVLERLGPERHAAARTATRGFAADLPAATGWQFGRRDLRAIEAPIAVLCGARRPRVWREVCYELARALGKARVLEADAGHFVQLEAPQVVAKTLRAIEAGDLPDTYSSGV
jgi:pimeloyl-ACP methyl ester carboxylesterase